MKRLILVSGLAFVLLLMFTCKRGVEPEQSLHALPKGVTLIEERNGRITRMSLVFHYQDVFNHRLAQLRIEENLKAVVSRGKGELERMRLLRDWVSGQWESSIPDPYPAWDAVTILKEIRAGRTGGFCAQYAVVMVQSSLSLGWQARYVAIATKAETF